MGYENMDFVVTDVNYVVERPHTASWAVKNICFEQNYVMAFSADGFVTYETDGRKISAGPNDVCIFPPGNVRSGKADRLHPWHFVSVNFDLTLYKGSKDGYNRSMIYVPKVSGEAGRLFFTLSKVWAGKEPLYRLKSRTIVQEILISLLSAKMESAAPGHGQLNFAKKYIQENFTRDISLEFLAGEAGFSLSHFRKLFTAYYGKSPKQYILYLRLNKAKDLLAANEFNVSETARLCGFKNVFYFSDLFKKTFGLAPNAFRTQRQEKSF